MDSHTLEDVEYPTTFLFLFYLTKKLCIICLLWNSRDSFFPISIFGAERIGLQTAVFRGLNSHAIWRQGSVVATDIDHLFTLYPRRWYKKHHLGKGVAAFESIKAAVTKKKAIKIFVWTLFEVSFN